MISMTTNTLPCATTVDLARLVFIREARKAAGLYCDGATRRDLTAAVKAADLEMALAISVGVVAALMVESEREIANRTGREATAYYINLLHAGRAAMMIPAA